MVLLVGCSSKEPIPKDIEIVLRLNAGFVHQGHVFLRIVDYNVLEIYHIGHFVPSGTIEYNNVFDFDMLDNFVSEFGDRVTGTTPDMERGFHKRSMELSQEQLNTIWTLAGNVGECTLYTWVGWGFNIQKVWVVIDGELFWSTFVSDTHGISRVRRNEDINVELLRLVHYIFDLSSVTV